MYLPNVSYCNNENDVHYNPIDFSKQYLATVARESGTISFNIWQTMGTDLITSISYSTDNGATWTTTANQNNKSENLQITVNVNAGDKVLWKGIAQQTGYYFDDETGDYVGSFFSSDCEFDVQGNIMSMCYGDNFNDVDTLEYEGQFYRLFFDYTGNLECNVVNAKDLSLSATTLTGICYSEMFSGCTSLTTAPSVLPATTLANGCYSGMFESCSSLTTAPALPATTLVDYCYSGMFESCSSLTTAPALPATTLADECYSAMFSDCTALTSAPVLPATTLAYRCYSAMFSGCTSLTTAPALPATTLADECYQYMFSHTNVLPDCSNIDFTSETVVASGGLIGLFAGTKVTDSDLMDILPINPNTNKYWLPVTTLVDYCYQYMFYGCTSLTTAPELPAITLADECYYEMFSGCTSLTTAPSVLPATTLAEGCYGGMFCDCTSLTSAPVLPAITLATYCYGSMFCDCTSLTTAPILPATTLVDICYQNMFRDCSNLNYIKAMFTTTPSDTYTEYWVSGVAATGTFVKNSAAQWNVTGANGVPSGWTVQTASE